MLILKPPRPATLLNFIKFLPSNIQSFNFFLFSKETFHEIDFFLMVFLTPSVTGVCNNFYVSHFFKKDHNKVTYGPVCDIWQFKNVSCWTSAVVLLIIKTIRQVFFSGWLFHNQVFYLSMTHGGYKGKS